MLMRLLAYPCIWYKEAQSWKDKYIGDSSYHTDDDFVSEMVIIKKTHIDDIPMPTLPIFHNVP